MLRPHVEATVTSSLQAGRHLLGLGVAATIATQPCHGGVKNAEHLDHAMACKLTDGMATCRNDIWAYTWRHAIRRARCTISAEPSYSKSLAPGQHEGAAGTTRMVWTHPAPESFRIFEIFRICSGQRPDPFRIQSEITSKLRGIP